MTENETTRKGVSLAARADGASLSLVFILLFVSSVSLAQAPPEWQAKLTAELKTLEADSADPQVVSPVQTYNSTPPSADAKAMTNEKWHQLTLFDPFVRAISKNPLSERLKGICNDEIIKIFVSGSDGGKVGFNAKTEHWTHKGMPKHEVPMQGKTWIGTVKPDESTGMQMIQKWVYR
jgi:hypothetical protein